MTLFVNLPWDTAAIASAEEQHAADSGEDIQKLGRWTSPAFLLYFTSSAQTLYNLNRNFQTGRPVALPRATA